MRNYETKILKRSGTLSLQFAENYYIDFTAIRAAKELGGVGGDTIEVWRDEVCMYSERPKPIRLAWPICSIRVGKAWRENGGGLAGAATRPFASETGDAGSAQNHQAQARAYEKKGHKAQQQGSVDVIGVRKMLVGHGVIFPVLWPTNCKKMHRFPSLVQKVTEWLFNNGYRANPQGAA